MVSLVIVFANEAMSFSPIAVHNIIIYYYYKWVGHSGGVEFIIKNMIHHILNIIIVYHCNCSCGYNNIRLAEENP